MKPIVLNRRNPANVRILALVQRGPHSVRCAALVGRRADDYQVGRDRARYLRPVSPSPPLPPCVRLSPHTATACQDIYPRFLLPTSAVFTALPFASVVL